MPLPLAGCVGGRAWVLGLGSRCSCTFVDGGAALSLKVLRLDGRRWQRRVSGGASMMGKPDPLGSGSSSRCLAVGVS